MRGLFASFSAAAMRSARELRPRVSFSGFPGVTSHQTRSRSRRCIASRQAARCAACGGSNVPPNRPILSPRGCGGRRMGAVFGAPCELGEGFFADLLTEKAPSRGVCAPLLATYHPLPQGEKVFECGARVGEHPVDCFCITRLHYAKMR